MKFKEFNKRLVLNKKTIVNLGKPEMDEVMGGTTIPCYTENYSYHVECPYVSCMCVPSQPPLCFPKTD